MMVIRHPQLATARRWTIAGGMIGICLIAYSLSVFFVPNPLFVLSTLFVAGLIGLFGVLLVAHRMAMVSFRVAIPTPKWLIIAIISLTLAGAMMIEYSLQNQMILPPLVLFWLGASYALITVWESWSGRGWPPSVPLWLIGLLALVMATVAGGRYVYDLSVFGLLLVFVFVALVLYICVIVPLGLLEIITRPRRSSAEPPYPDVSVIIPAYNESANITKSIESVLALNYPSEHLEVIVIDDGSEDDTYDLATGYRDRGVRVMHRPNGGRAAARNYGFFASNGDLIVTLDADSILTEDALNTIVGAFQADADLGAVAGDLRVENDQGILARIQSIEYIFSINTFRRACSYFNTVPVVPGCLAGFRRSALERRYWFDPDTETEDFDATLQLLRDGWKIRQVDGVAKTFVPETIGGLYRQRIRWYSGTLRCFLKHTGMYRQYDWNYLQMLIFPILTVSYAFRPVAGAVILAVVVHGVFITATVPLLAVVYFFAIIGVAVALTLLALGGAFKAFPWFVFLLIGYRQFIDFVFLRSMIGVLLDPGIERHVSGDVGEYGPDIVGQGARS